MSDSFTIHEVAKLVGISKKTLIKWEKLGVIPVPLRSPVGYRLYDENGIKEIESFIQKRYSKDGVING